MSIQELRQAIHELPLQQRRVLLAEMAADLQTDLATLQTSAERAATDAWLDGLTPEEDAKLNAKLAEGITSLDAGKGLDGETVMAELNERFRAGD